jgi:group I intron endonuclease
MNTDFCVYVIHNAANGKRYVGKTTRGISERWSVHKSEARRGCKNYFKNAIRKHGAENFEVAGYIALGENFHRGKTPKEINDTLSELEKLHIARLSTTDPAKGYNCTAGGDGLVATPAIRDKLSKSQRVAQARPETRARRRGQKRSVEARAKMRAAKLNNWNNPEYRMKMSDAHKGHRASPETRAKFRARKPSPETRAKMRAANVGKIRSPEQCANMRAGWARRRAAKNAHPVTVPKDSEGWS